MSDYMQRLGNVRIALHLLFIAAVIMIAAFVSDQNEKKLVSNLQSHIETQIDTLWELALITDRNGGDEVISTIISDCPRRVEYETMLNELSTLSKKELITVQNLYESCGNFYAERKALMVSKLERELQIALEYAELLTFLKEDTTELYKLKTWSTLVSLEQTRSFLLADQSVIQAKIITLLISGATPSSTDVRILVQDVQEIGELLNVRDHEIGTLRGELQS